MFSNHEMCEITVPVNHYDVITFHWKSSANPRWNYTGNGRILHGSAVIRGGIKIFRGGIISGQVSGIAGGSEKSSAGVGGLVKIPLDCTVPYSRLWTQYGVRKHDHIRTSYLSYPPQPCSAHSLSGENKLSKITAVWISD